MMYIFFSTIFIIWSHVCFVIFYKVYTDKRLTPVFANLSENKKSLYNKLK